MRYPSNVVTLSDTRSQYPNAPGDPEKCFYCNGLTGKEHDAECVVPHRPIHIRLSIDLVVSVPRSWDEGDIDFHYNESSSCKSNLLDHVFRQLGENGCLCHTAEIEYIDEASIEEALAANLVPDSESDGWREKAKYLDKQECEDSDFEVSGPVQ